MTLQFCTSVFAGNMNKIHGTNPQNQPHKDIRTRSQGTLVGTNKDSKLNNPSTNSMAMEKTQNKPGANGNQEGSQGVNQQQSENNKQFKNFDSLAGHSSSNKGRNRVDVDDSEDLDNPIDESANQHADNTDSNGGQTFPNSL